MYCVQHKQVGEKPIWEKENGRKMQIRTKSNEIEKKRYS